jgi:hypothetical protein
LGCDMRISVGYMVTRLHQLHKLHEKLHALFPDVTM